MASFLQRLFHRRIVLVATALLALIVVLALGASFFAGSPNQLAVTQRLHGPSWVHLMGTDELGRDVWARVIHGARYSLAIGALTTLGAVVLGICVGLLAGFFQRLDAPLMRVIDAMMAFPDILLAIALVAILNPSLSNVTLALVIVYTPSIARVVRGSTLVLRRMLFVEAAQAVGARTPHILWHHVLPNLISPVVVQGTFIFAYAVLAEAGLSFLGVGVPPDIPTWGTMVASGQQYAASAFWVVLFPGLAITVTAMSVQLLGDGLRDMLDPRLRKAA